MGTNNITEKRYQTARKIVHEILEIVYYCRNSGVNKVYVSSLICRPQYKSKVYEINELRKLNAVIQNYYFIYCGNIEKYHLGLDKVYLNRAGTILLANNFLNYLNRSDNFDSFW